jgi:hypothetical protein
MPRRIRESKKTIQIRLSVDEDGVARTGLADDLDGVL